MSAILRNLVRIEELARRAFFSSLVRLTQRDPAPPDGALRGRPLRVLFILEDAIGDMILTIPAIRAIAAAHPDTVVDVVTWEGPAEVLRDAAFVRRLILFPRYDRRRIRAWAAARRNGPYDVVVDGMVMRAHVRSRSLAMMIGSGARYWVGESGRGSEYLLNVLRPAATAQTPHLLRMLALADPFLAGPAPLRPILAVSNAERAAAEHAWNAQQAGGRPRILINVSSNGSQRKWPADGFVAVASHIRQRQPDARLIVVGLERDRETMARVAAAGDGLAIASTIREVIALVEASDMVLSPDTAICHMASAFERPLVSIHHAGMEAWHPYDTPGVKVVGASAASSETVPVRAVTRAIDDVLGKLAAKTSRSASA